MFLLYFVIFLCVSLSALDEYQKLCTQLQTGPGGGPLPGGGGPLPGGGGGRPGIPQVPGIYPRPPYPGPPIPFQPQPGPDQYPGLSK